MKRNIDATRGLIFSQMVLLALTRKGMVRDEAYALVQRNSHAFASDALPVAFLLGPARDRPAGYTLRQVT